MATNTPTSILSEARQLIYLTGPLIISNVAQIGMSLVDTIMAGRHADTSLAGVAVGAGLWMPFYLALTGIFMVVTPIIAHEVGKRRFREVKRYLNQLIWLALLVSPLFVVIVNQASLAFDWLGVTGPVREQGAGYLQAVSFGLPALALFLVLRGLNEGYHQTRPYMIVSVSAFLCNIPLNYLFIYGKLGLPEMGGIGCGWATAVVLWVQFLTLLIISLRKQKQFRIKLLSHFGWIQPDRLLRVIKLGLPVGFSMLVETTMFSLIALFVARLGSAMVAGHQIAFSLTAFIFMVPLSLSAAVTIRCSYLLGKGKAQQARTSYTAALLLTLLATVFSSALLLLFADKVVGLYSSSPPVQAVALDLLGIAALFLVFDALQVVIAGALRGYKDTRVTLIAMMFASWGLSIPIGYTLGMKDFLVPAMGPAGFWVGLVIGLTFVAGVLGWRLRHISYAENITTLYISNKRSDGELAFHHQK